MHDPSDDMYYIHGYLQPGERVLWSGKPLLPAIRRQYRGAAMGFVFPQSIFFLLLTVMLFLDPEQAGETLLNLGLPLLGIFSLSYMSSRILANRAANKAAQETLYLITDRRVLVARGTKEYTLTSVQYGDINRMDITDRGQESTLRMQLKGRGSLELAGLDDGIHVFRLIEGLREEGRVRSTNVSAAPQSEKSAEKTEAALVRNESTVQPKVQAEGEDESQTLLLQENIAQ